MTASPRWILVVVAGVTLWCVILAAGLRHLFGAEISSGLLVGGLFTMGALAILMIANEVRHALPTPAGCDPGRRSRADREWIEGSRAEARRAALGLTPASGRANRLRHHRKVRRPVPEPAAALAHC